MSDLENASALFATVPEDVFGVYEGGGANVKRVVDLLEYRKEDVSIAASIPIGSVRYDVRMPDALRERAMEWATALNLVGTFFKDQKKTLLWFRTPNPLLGGMTPRDMIRLGRSRKLLKFIQTALAENVQ